MAFAQWMRVLDTLNGLVQVAGRFRRPAAEDPTSLQTFAGGGPLGHLEARLAGVVVAALKEAFDRDSARMELERSHIEAERRRAEEALRAELRRQAADRLSGQLRLVAIMAMSLWALSAALGVWLPGMHDGAPRVLLGAGWLLDTIALAAAFTGWQSISTWSAAPQADAINPPQTRMLIAAPWLLIAALMLIGASLLVAL